MTHVFDPGNGYIVVDGQIVERDALRVAEELKRYDPNLEVICLDPEKADVNDAPFIICEYVNGVFKRIFETWCLDDRVLDRIKLADQQKFDPSLRLEDLEKVNYERKLSRFKDVMGEKKDLVQHVASMKSKYVFKDEQTGEKVTLFDDRPSERGSFGLSKKVRNGSPVGKLTPLYGSSHAIHNFGT
jgi:hypothetical protein